MGQVRPYNPTAPTDTETVDPKTFEFKMVAVTENAQKMLIDKCWVDWRQESSNDKPTISDTQEKNN